MNYISTRYHFFKEKNEIFDKYILYAIYSIFFLLPWYYNYSGQIQPVDICILLTAILLTVCKKSSGFDLLAHSRKYAIMLVLMMYILIRYIISYIYNINMIYEVFANAYYIVLLTVFISMLLYLYQSRSHQEFYEIILNCLLITSILPLCTLIIYGPDYGLAKLQLEEPTVVRPVLTFNNANQLGFFSFVNLSIFFYLSLFTESQNIKVKKICSLLIININIIFLLLSVSRAAAPAIILYLYSYLLIFKLSFIKKHPYFSLLFISIILIGWVLSIYIYHHLLLIKLGIPSAIKIGFIEDLYGRTMKGISYNFNNVYLFIFGYGSETNPLREKSLEFHNNFVSIFNQVGILGLLIYSYIIFQFFHELIKKGFLYLLPFLCYLCYSEMHYAFRTRMNWLFFAILIFLSISRSSIQSSQIDNCSSNVMDS